ncbi:metallophosphoesterase family protein [Bdellovibrio svalbardensis]|uniref:PhoD-like phosphatase domain-containing protein n=1 Tax=Bdellovibrio svalbardensis TaxID=2972972 RepID=A0ABT6DHW7_9BACT|nr:hypothetical protein [Bdellovibrio svalbardensis]MDG0816445.1 hypothetical protein [Bdellovibrio svalbardensis]
MTQDGKTINFIHAFLGRGENGTQKIVLLAPYHTNFATATCNLFQNGIKVASKTTGFKDKEVRNFIFEFENLLVDVEYTYNFEANNQILDLGGGLANDDLKFTYWKTLSSSSEVVLVSCNGVDEFKKPTLKWEMWRRLHNTAITATEKPKLLILGGDQYYQDATEKEFIDKLKGEVTPELRLQVKMAAIKRAFEQTSDLSYRKLMAQIPSIAMLDDHDITDGAGGRLFVGNEFEKKYLNYAPILIEVFEAFQASRNPSPLIKKSGSGYSCILDLGNSALVVLDLRTEKNSMKKKLMENDHKAAVFEAIQALPHKNVMLLIPVVPARSSRELEGALTGLAKLCKLKSVQNWFSKIHPKLGELISFIAESEDDLEDGLTSDSGLPFFTELLTAMSTKAAKGTNYTILTGDIHTGGTVEMMVTTSSTRFTVPIIVSSPIGYYPMPKIAEGLLKESTYIRIQSGEVLIEAVPNQFYTNRNFVFLNPEKLITDKVHAARIYQEGVSGFKRLALDSWEPDKLTPHTATTIAVKPEPATAETTL